MRIVAQAPSAEQAETLADAAVDGLSDYLHAVAAREATPEKDRVRLEPLGRGRGVVINSGVRLQASALAFFIVFALSAAAAVFVGRVRRGWSQAAAEAREREHLPSAAVGGRERSVADVR
jgi:hypothetical protein